MNSCGRHASTRTNIYLAFQKSYPLSPSPLQFLTLLTFAIDPMQKGPIEMGPDYAREEDPPFANRHIAIVFLTLVAASVRLKGLVTVIYVCKWGPGQDCSWGFVPLVAK